MFLADSASIRKEMALSEPGALSIPDQPDPALDQQASSFVQSVLQFNPENPAQHDERTRNTAAVEGPGSKTQQEASYRSAMLKEPIRKLAARGEDGG